MSSIYLNVTIVKKQRTQNFDFLSLKYSSELQLTHISLNFKNYCSNLKIRDLGAKLYKNCELKVKVWWVEARERKERAFFAMLNLSEGNVF